jgi:hypothetical protein
MAKIIYAFVTKPQDRSDDLMRILNLVNNGAKGFIQGTPSGRFCIIREYTPTELVNTLDLPIEEISRLKADHNTIRRWLSEGR